MGRRWGWGMVAVLAGCTGARIAAHTTDAATTAVETTGDDESTSGAATTTTDQPGGMFVPEPDLGSSDRECDVWAQDCDPGFKCVAWANDGGSSWNATKCTPIAPDPKPPGDVCTVPDNGTSGRDDCEAGAMCWDVDPETKMGTCVALCIGSRAKPICQPPCSTCIIANDGVLTLCLPMCDPLLQDCPNGLACFPSLGAFVCAPDWQFAGNYADPCEFLNSCAPGLFCADPGVVPYCGGEQGCCTKFCDASAANECPDSDIGVECIPWYDDENPKPPCIASEVGACLRP